MIFPIINNKIINLCVQIAGFGFLLAGGAVYWLKKGIDRCVEKRNLEKSKAYMPMQEDEP